MIIEDIKKLVQILSYLKPYKLRLLGGLFILFLTASLELVNPKLFREIVNELNDGLRSMDNIYFYLMLVVAIVLMKGILIFFSRYILISISRRVEYDIRNKLFRHMLTLPSNFFDKNKTGDIISRLTSDIEHVRMIYGPGIMYTFNMFFILTLAFGSMYVIDEMLSIYVIVPLIGLAYVIWFIGRKYYDRSLKVQEELAKMSSFVNETLEGIRVIKSFVREELVQKSFRKINKEFIKKNMLLARRSGVFRPTLYFIAGTTSIVVLLVGGLKVSQGAFTLGQLVEFLKYVEVLSIPIMAFGWVTSLFQRGFASYDRLNSFLREEPQTSNISGVRMLGSSLGVGGDREGGGVDIRVSGLSFKYPNTNHMVLDDISFNISAGEKVAIIGSTGCGKTTLISLFPRIYEPSQGNILINGKDSKEYTLQELRSFFGYVPQNNFIFPYTVKENISFGNSLSEEQMIKFSKISCLHEEVLNFANGYDEYIGERGVTLSGGQKQRLGIARALGLEPKVLLFDDSFSAIDVSTENKILESLFKEYANRSIILVAHRISTVKNVDKIIIMNNGKIVGQGSPKELLKTKNYYSNIVEEERLVKEYGI